MTEQTLASPTEHRLRPDHTMAAESVFYGAYGAFTEGPKNAPTERKKPIDGQDQIVADDPVLKFVKERFTAAASRIEPFANQPTSPEEIQDAFMQKATAEAKRFYKETPTFIGGRIERANRLLHDFTGRAIQLYEAGEADAVTIKVFFGRLEHFETIGSGGHSSIVRKIDEPMPSTTAQERYAKTVKSLLEGRSDVQEQESGGFKHINGDRYATSESETTDRYYISPKLNAQPEEVIRIWVETLDDLGLGDTLYYKIGYKLSRRYDKLIAYASPETATDTDRALQEFMRRCPPELLSDTTIPTGLAYAKGIARAPEPIELNKLLHYRGEKTVSYNEAIATLTEMALQRASYDFMQQGKTAEAVKPRELSRAALPYFIQLVKLSGLDPVTMKTM